MRSRAITVVAALVTCVLAGACSDDRAAEPAPTGTKPAPSTERPTTTARRTTTTERPTTTVERTTTTDAPTTTAAPTTTIAETTTTAPTTTVAPVDTTPVAVPVAVAPDPVCVREVQPGDSLTDIVVAIGNPALTVDGVVGENAIPDRNTINAGDLLDVCVGNGIDDVAGTPRSVAAPPAPPPVVDPATALAAGTGVAAQQAKLNALFAGYGLAPLDVDGDSGRLTEQQLCAARLALGLPVSRADMEPGGAEEQALMAAGAIAIPANAPTGANRWVLIDRTCQVMFVGAGAGQLAFVFRTSTGSSGFETRLQDASRVFRYLPSPGNGGWHNSTDYPVTGDNPLNGNMYKPLYFDGGQAIHGANSVPASPASKGCARLRVGDQQALVDWLGLGGVSRSIWDTGPIDLTVRVVGSY